MIFKLGQIKIEITIDMPQTILINKLLQSEINEIKSGGIFIPLKTKGSIELILDLDPVELLDTKLSLWFHIYEFINNEWRHVVGARWVGGANYDEEFGANHNPRLWFDAERVAGKNIRIEIENPKGQQVGYKLVLK